MAYKLTKDNCPNCNNSHSHEISDGTNWRKCDECGTEFIAAILSNGTAADPDDDEVNPEVQKYLRERTVSDELNHLRNAFHELWDEISKVMKDSMKQIRDAGKGIR